MHSTQTKRIGAGCQSNFIGQRRNTLSCIVFLCAMHVNGAFRLLRASMCCVQRTDLSTAPVAGRHGRGSSSPPRSTGMHWLYYGAGHRSVEVRLAANRCVSCGAGIAPSPFFWPGPARAAGRFCCGRTLIGHCGYLHVVLRRLGIRVGGDRSSRGREGGAAAGTVDRSIGAAKDLATAAISCTPAWSRTACR